MKLMMLNMKVWLFSCLVVVTFVSCNRPPREGWRFSDDIYWAVDETLRPVFEKEMEAYAGQDSSAVFQTQFLPGDSVLALLVSDSVRCCVSTRPLTDYERYAIREKSLNVSEDRIATDALALLVSKGNSDSVMSLDQLRDILLGKITRWDDVFSSRKHGEISIVVDHSKSGVLRCLREVVCDGQAIKGNLYAQGSVESVIECVSADSMVVGVVSVSGLPLDSLSGSYFDHPDVTVMYVSSDMVSTACRPYLYHLSMGDYPLVRSVYVVTTDPRRTSSVKSFHGFLKGKQGQEIISAHSRMMPVQTLLPL